MAQRDPSCAVALQEDGSGQAAVRSLAVGRTWCPRWRRQQQSSGAASRSEHAAAVWGAVAVKMKAGGRRAGAASEPEAERMRDFF
jgi:hypothetical protein